MEGQLIQFQFHKVQFKEGFKLSELMLFLFQFHKVQFKVYK